MSANEFLIRNTLPEELDQYIEVLERAASWMEANNLCQWIPGTFRQDEARSHIRSAIQNQTSYVVIHSPTSTIAAIFALNYEDPFDEMLWAHYAQDWKDAIYVHRLVVEADFQGRGIVPQILQFTEALTNCLSSTTHVGCAQFECPKGTMTTSTGYKAETVTAFTMCRYSPPGNIAGQFAKNGNKPKPK
ncbi:hypothetical protein BG006_006024 [Podila minutissima]|uniref:N-acetyltransferase domain-containing protein n=1 Tax=Podila minutissima TaxID=64525 RepID=A0A9P5SRZ7_9FUNG|nr:hypothetical protein BG006_006024 [Podila minutissima]